MTPEQERKDREALARELWWPHHPSRYRDVALDDLCNGSIGEVTLEFEDFVSIVDAVIDHHDAPSRIEALEAKLDRAIEALRAVSYVKPMSQVVSASHRLVEVQEIAAAALSNIEDKTPSPGHMTEREWTIAKNAGLIEDT